jgi:hypothetical protein
MPMPNRRTYGVRYIHIPYVAVIVCTQLGIAHIPPLKTPGVVLATVHERTCYDACRERLPCYAVVLKVKKRLKKLLGVGNGFG